MNEVARVSKLVIQAKIIAINAMKTISYAKNVKMASLRIKTVLAPIQVIVKYLLMAIVFSVNQTII
jgi:hypothetical protein